MGVGRVFGAALGHGGAGYAYHVESIFVKPDDTSVQITWTDPCDTDWAGTKIVRKIGTHPDGVTDGVLVADCQVRNQYAQVAYLDTGLVNGTTYYYMAFPYSQKGCNVSTLNRAERVTPTYGLFWWEYSGAHTSSVITVDGVQRRLITITGSGILTITGKMTGDICLVGGGRTGGTAPSGYGGAGAYMTEALGVEFTSGPIVVAAANGASTYASFSAAAGSGPNGGTGGGAGSLTAAGAGDSVRKIPFGRSTIFPLVHCGGGGGGGFTSSGSSSYHRSGGTGGTNGGPGGTSGTGFPSGGSGGNYGGGNGGTAPSGSTSAPGGNATYYGSGGGGGATSSDGPNGAGGAGYQGVIYIIVDEP